MIGNEISGSEAPLEHQLTYLIPREAEIKKELNAFISSSIFHSHFNLIGYNGLKSPSLPFDEVQQQRHANYQKVRQLFSFASDCVPDMENGHAFENTSLPMCCTIERCLMLCLPSHKIVGAVYFRIELALRRCLVANIAVDSAHQGKRLGSILWQSASLIAILYGCKIISATPDENLDERLLKKFYQRLGCQFHIVNNPLSYVDKIAILNLQDERSQTVFLADFKLLAASYDIARWLKQLLNPEDNKGEHSLESNQATAIAHLGAFFFKDLLGFLKETDPEYAHHPVLLDKTSPSLLTSFKLAISCDKKPISYSVECNHFVTRHKIKS